MERKKKTVIAIGFNAGGNPFCPVYSKLEDFDRMDPEAAFSGDGGVRFLRENGCEVIPVFFARARGRMALDTFKALVDELCAAIPGEQKVDGVYLNIGGGMLVDFIGNGDAFFVSRLRELVGADIPIAAPMDFHGGMSYTLWKALNIITTFRTNPHVDIEETRLRAARFLLRAMESGVTVRNIGVKIPMVLADSLKQEEGAGAKVNALLEALEVIDGVWSASLMTGSAWSNSPSTGSLLTVSCEPRAFVTAGDALLDAARQIWSIKEDYISMNPVAEPREAFELADALLERRYAGGQCGGPAAGGAGSNAQSPAPGPVFIDDSGDNPTNSATGDSAYMLALALEMKQKDILIAGLWDEAFVRCCESAGVGNVVHAPIGASVCSTGTRITVEARVLGLRYGEENPAGRAGASDGDGRSPEAADKQANGVKVRIDDVVVLVTAGREGVLNQSFMESFGEDCMSYKKIVVKLGYLLEDFAKIASGVYIARSPGNVDLNFERINGLMDAIPRPMYPFDSDFEFEPVLIW